MKYCAQCRSEYVEDVKECADCGSTEFLGLEALRERGLAPLHELDKRRFVKAGSVEDPLTSERVVAALTEAKVPVISREAHASSVDLLTSGTLSSWWEILVPEEHLAKAGELLEEIRKRSESETQQNIEAAEEEALSGPTEIPS